MTLLVAAVALTLVTQGNGLPFGQPPRTRVVRHGDDRLVGITAVDLVITPLSDAAAQCDVHKERLAFDGVAGLTRHSLKATWSARDSSWFYTVFVSAATVSVERRCVTTVTSRLVAHVDGVPAADEVAPPGAWGSLLVGAMTLIENSRTVVSTSGKHAAGVREAMHAQLTGISERIHLANTRANR